MEIKKIECVTCKVSHPDTLYPSDDQVCVYCKADEVERLAPPEVEETEEVTQEQTEQQKAQQELAMRALSRKHLLPFVERFNSDYVAGWVHKDICLRLEKFSEDVNNRKSPRLMLFMPPRHGKSTLASVAFPAWHMGRNPEHEFISCSYSGSLAMNFSRKVRHQLREPNFKNVFSGVSVSYTHLTLPTICSV